MSSLSDKLAAALDSRERRLIRRRLPELPPDGESPREIDFTSNDYLSLSASPALRNAVLSALSATTNILGSGGSRLLVPSKPHFDLESRLCRFFGADAALLFNSGFEANVGFFASVPQPRDVVLYDAHIHASVHDGMHLSRLTAGESLLPFSHNSVPDLRRVLSKLLDDRGGLKKGKTNVFVAVESLYSMDGTIAPLTQIVECVEEMLPAGNGYVVVDEAHSTGIYGPKGRGLVVELGLEKRVYARLHTFGKALAASGAVFLTTRLVKDYLLNYARSLIYTTTLPFANIVAVNCSFDLLEDGTTEELSAHLLSISAYFVDLLRSQLKNYPPSLLRLPDHLFPTISDQSRGEAALEHPSRPWEIESRDELSSESQPIVPIPTPIIPVLTPEPRELSAFLLKYAAAAPSSVIQEQVTLTSPLPPFSEVSTSERAPIASLLTDSFGVKLLTKPIYPPTVDKGTSRVRICLHAGHTREDVALLAQGIFAWAEMRMQEERKGEEKRRALARDMGMGVWMEAKL